AQVTLQQVKVEGLPAADQRKLADALAKVESALNERKMARAEFEIGEKSLEEKNYAEALKHYRTAADNKFADDPTKTKAASQIAVAEAAMAPGEKPKGTDNRSIYKEAVADYKAGKLEDARGKFAQLQQAGYHGGLFDRKPGSFIAE